MDQTSDKNITPANEQDQAGDSIIINNSVVASIVRLAALEVDGTVAVGTGRFVDSLTEIIKGRESDRGVCVTLNAQDEYVIEIHVVMRFGIELAKIAQAIQQNIREKVAHMTMKNVGKVDVIIEGIRVASERNLLPICEKDRMQAPESTLPDSAI